ncbi:MAG: peptide chain release factor 1 [Clostridium sp.]|nr:peptide chain release factor 1 [Clostridium sp.]
MIERLGFVENQYEELTMRISDPSVIADTENWQKLVKEHSDLQHIVEEYREYKRVKEELDDNLEMLESENDQEMREMFNDDIRKLRPEMEQIERNLELLLLPKDPNDNKNVFVEVRAGAGGDEAALFAHSLFRMYSKYAENQNWGVEIMSMNSTDIGGLKEVVFMIKGDGAYSRLKYESGVHRVQRVPDTENSGRVHTSTVTVAVLPEVDDVDIDISPNDIRVDVYRSSGNGGQSVNTTDSAVRITHLETGVVVSCQDEKSQHKNKDKAMKILKSRLFDLAEEERSKGISDERKSQVGTGDRSERIRTYNFPQGRITDHRINTTIHKMDTFLDGDIEEMISALANFDQTEKLKALGNRKIGKGA